MGQPTQTAGTSAETAPAAATAGFLGWSPDTTSRTGYTLQSGATNKRGSGEVSDAVTRVKQFYR